MSPSDAAPRPRKSRLSPEEQALVGRLRAGDGDALTELYERYSGMLLGLAQRIVGNSAEAEEVLQEVFLQVWNQVERYDSTRAALSTWIVMITRSRSIDRLRSRRVAERTASAAHQENSRRHTSPRGTRDVLMDERRGRLDRELAELPAEQRRVLEMAFFDGMTQSEIAASTGTPLGTVKTRTLLAMKKLRRALAEDIGDLL